MSAVVCRPFPFASALRYTAGGTESCVAVLHFALSREYTYSSGGGRFSAALMTVLTRDTQVTRRYTVKDPSQRVGSPSCVGYRWHGICFVTNGLMGPFYYWLLKAGIDSSPFFRWIDGTCIYCLYF
ncbi:uncharacterized protein LOC123512724 isoform X2 [Portunus trituberculatus]|uniref:uncharacterized protein LOC123512724 isoform X2 n=1 Tax=Portunus trituberculatus TaxID=210409 RepID=UPI001E1CD628|nr:uncharacterized protein LOC123512724 isoform X2 [Portunus trituberculatus]